MKYNESLLKSLANEIGQALSKYRQSTENTLVTDIYLQPVRSSSELLVYDDEEELKVISVPQLNDMAADTFYADMENILRKTLQLIDSSDSLDSLSVWKPFSFVMVDEDSENFYELMLMDDDTMLASQTLMEGLDKELDDFLYELLNK
ncbi:MAG: hypothetical protein J6V02_04160 [Bacteroidaceae bacterium]|nr:hypothetical protein [Bacteroidaceae bacterium]